MPESKKDKQQPERMRILAFDGGPSSLITLRVLREIEVMFPGFLERTRMFSGTSLGAFVSLYLAHALTLKQRKGDTSPSSVQIIDDCIEFNDRITRQFKVRPINVLRAASGLLPLYDGEGIRSILEETFGEAKLCELDRMVVIEAFDSTVWRKTTYHQFPPEADVLTTIVDAALASSAFPVLMPLYRSGTNLGERGNNLMMDGALSNNSTAMTALSDALLYLAHQDGHDAMEDTQSEARYLPRVSILSLGCTPQSAKWFEKWSEISASLSMFLDSLLPGHPRRPMLKQSYGWIWLLLHNVRAAMAFVEGGAQSDVRYATELLGPLRFFRFRPDLNALDVMLSLVGNPDTVIRQSAETALLTWRQEFEAYELMQKQPPSLRKPWHHLLGWVEEYWMNAPPPTE
ncbi:patatin-like phospholipase family protein [Stigmatella hybrida]|uniref:patatin-like phospholipase family protein n=1 Tax=Stigmatella hybrida TaxID=394097 RepID=UPI001CDB2573|nr:patatin-like phospholipase family protein [Stigmatella hybrida]